VDQRFVDSPDEERLAVLLTRLDEHLDTAWLALETFEETQEPELLRTALLGWRKSEEAKRRLDRSFGRVADDDLHEELREWQALTLDDYEQVAELIAPVQAAIARHVETRQAGEEPPPLNVTLPGPNQNPVIGKRRRKRN
jgi:hypothetical protein